MACAIPDQNYALNVPTPPKQRTLAQHELLVIVTGSADQAGQVVNPLQRQSRCANCSEPGQTI